MRISMNDVRVRPVAANEEKDRGGIVDFPALLLGRSLR